MFTTFLILFTHLDYIKNKIIPNQENPPPKNSPPKKSPPKNSPDNTKNSSLSILKFYLMFSFVVICCLGVAAMMYFQISAFKGRILNQYYYLAPYICLWIIAIGSLIFVTIMIMHNGCTWKCMLKCTVLGLGTMTMQLLSWHLVFVLYGLILNPLRAFLYSVAIIIAVLWAIFTLAFLSRIINYITCQVFSRITYLIIGCVSFIFYLCELTVYIFGCTNICCNCGDICGALINKIKGIVCKHIDELKGIALMGCLITLLTFAGGFSVFILHISITSEHPTLDELTKSIIPKVFLILIIWLLYNIFLNSNRTGELWLLPRLYTDLRELWNYVDYWQETNTHS